MPGSGLRAQDKKNYPQWEGTPHRVSDVFPALVLQRCVYTSRRPYDGAPTNTWEDAVLTSSFQIVPASDTVQQDNTYTALLSSLRPIDAGNLLGQEQIPEGHHKYLWPRIAEGLQEITGQ